MSPRLFCCIFGVMLLADASVRSEVPALRMDLHGDPLPAGAIARMGTLRWRHTGYVQSAVFSPDGKLIASTCNERDEDEVWLWDAATGRQVSRIKVDSSARVHAFMPDGKALLLEVGGGLALYDVSSAPANPAIPQNREESSLCGPGARR